MVVDLLGGRSKLPVARSGASSLEQICSRGGSLREAGCNTSWQWVARRRYAWLCDRRPAGSLWQGGQTADQNECSFIRKAMVTGVCLRPT